MKTITKIAALGIVAIGFAGCGEDNEKNVTKDPVTGKAVAPGKKPVNVSTDSEGAMKGMQNKAPMQTNKDYQGKGDK